jgi:hypothetical protein
MLYGDNGSAQASNLPPERTGKKVTLPLKSAAQRTSRFSCRAGPL